MYLLVPGFDLAPKSEGGQSSSNEPAFLSYSQTDDRWTELPLPPGNSARLSLVTAGDKVVGYQRTQERVGPDFVPDPHEVEPDLIYDPASRTWAELPLDPLLPSFGRSMVWTERELVLLGNEVVPSPGAEQPSLIRAAALDLATGQWRRFPDSEILGYAPTWFWAGERIVNPSVGSIDGGQVNNWGRSYPFGGALDPVTGQWSPLPDPPPELVPDPRGEPPGWVVGAVAGGDMVVGIQGVALDVATETWAQLERPTGGADELQTTVWAEDRLFVWGGVREAATLVDQGWTWTPQ